MKGINSVELKQIEEFYTKWFTKEREYRRMMSCAIGWIMEAILIFLMIIPVQEAEMSVLLCFMGLHIQGVKLMVDPYCYEYENKSRIRLLDKLQYTPVNASLYRRYIVMKCVRHTSIMLAACLIVQIGGALMMLGSISWINILVPIALVFSLPVVLIVPTIYVKR